MLSRYSVKAFGGGPTIDPASEKLLSKNGQTRFHVPTEKVMDVQGNKDPHAFIRLQRWLYGRFHPDKVYILDNDRPDNHAGYYWLGKLSL